MNDEAVDLWMDCFGELPVKLFEKMVVNYAKNNKFFPTVSEMFLELDVMRIHLSSEFNWERCKREFPDGRMSPKYTDVEYAELQKNLEIVNRMTEDRLNGM